MTSPAPLLFLVSGAWHQPANYQPLIDELHKLGLKLHVGTSKSLVSAPNRPTNVTAQDDTDAIRAQVIAQLDAERERDIVVLAHSYGGIPGGAAPRGLSKINRIGAGNRNGVVGLIWLSAFLVDEGNNMHSGPQAENLLPEEQGASGYVETDTPRQGLLWVPNPGPIFYNDCDEATINQQKKYLLPQAVSAFATPAAPPAWKDEGFVGKLAYVRHTLDKAIPPAHQDRLMRFTGQEWITRDIEASHSAFASKPEELAGILKELIAVFTA